MAIHNNKPSSFLLLSLLLILSLLSPPPISAAAAASSHRHDNEKLAFHSIYQFGDSLSDTGNLIRDNPAGAHSAFVSFPYGQTMRRPTGRCSDGLLTVDYFARFFHLPLLNPYLNKHANFTYGANFAVAGSTALDTSVLRARHNIISPATNSSLSVQLQWFKSHLDSVCRRHNHGGGSSKCQRDKVRDSLILMGEVGGNDYNYAILQGKSMEELQISLAPEVVNAIRSAVEEVIKLGAKRVVVPGNFPIGCMPIYLALFESRDSSMYDELNCLRGLNSFARYHNDLLQFALADLQLRHPNVAIVYGDYYSGLRWIIRNAESLGFDDKDVLQKTCCGTGNSKYNFDLTRMCGSHGTTVCENPSGRMSWDGIHLTQHAYLHLAQFLLRSFVPAILQVV